MSLPKSGLDLVAENAAGYISDLGAATQATDKFTGGLGAAAAESSSMREIVTGALRAVGEMVVSALAEAAQAVAQFAIDSVNAAGDFEASINNLAAVTGTALADAGFSMDDLSNKALEMGRKTKYSAAESVEAMTELVKGGVPVADVMNAATEATLDLAAAAKVDLGSAAEIVAKQLGVWGEQVGAVEVTNLLTQAANASTVGVEDLALGLANAGGSAKTAGVQYDELVKTMALVAPNFSSAADAGTSLKTFISRLIPTTNDAKEAMYDLGLATEHGKSKFYDAEGNFIGMEAAARLLHEATAGLSEEQKSLAFNTIFGSDAIRAAAAIADAGAEGYNKMGQDMAKAGTAAEVAAQQNQGWNYILEQISGSIETLQIVLGQKLIPLLTPLATQFGNVVNVALEFAQAGSVSEESLDSLASVFGTTGADLKGLVGSIQAGGQALLDDWAGPIETAEAVTTQVMTAIESVVDDVLSGVADFWQQNGADIMADATTTYETIRSVVDVALKFIGALITTVLSFVQDFWRDHGAELMAIARATWDIISGVVQTALDLIKGIFAAGTALLKGDWQAFGQILWDTAKTFFNNIVGVFTAGKTLIVSAITIIIDEVKSRWDSFVNSASEIGRNIIDGIIRGVRSAAENLARAAADAAKAALDAAKAALGISSPSKVFADEVGAMIPEGVVIGIRGNLGPLRDQMADMQQMLVGNLRASVPSAAQMAGGGVVNNYYGHTGNQYNLGVTTTAAPNAIEQSFSIMKALAL